MAQTAVASNTPFLWEGTDRNGKKIKGKSLANDEASVRADLRRQGVVPTRIRKQRQGLFSGGGKIVTGDIATIQPPAGHDAGSRHPAGAGIRDRWQRPRERCDAEADSWHQSRRRGRQLRWPRHWPSTHCTLMTCS